MNETDRLLNGTPSSFAIRRKNLTNKVLLIIFLCYTVAFSMLIPVYPKLLLSLTKDRSGESSMIYGLASSLRHFFEFFSSQYLGWKSDMIGRKPVLLFALSGVFFEFLLLAAYPSIISVLLSKVISGVFDVTMIIAHAIVIDIATHNNESVTQQFGVLGAVLGFGFVFGPLTGSIIASYNMQLCFLVSAGFVLVALVTTFYFLDESCPEVLDRSVPPPASTDSRPSEAHASQSTFNMNPCHAMSVFFQQPHLRMLAVPYVLMHFSHGVFYIWVLYMHRRFQCSIVQAGMFISVTGLGAVLVQGGLIKLVIPDLWSEKQAALLCMAFMGLQYLLYAITSDLTTFYIITIAFAFTTMAMPALQAIIVHKSGGIRQGVIQGALGSLRMITAFFSSLCFPVTFAVSLELKPPIPGLPFVLGGLVALCSAAFTTYYFSMETKLPPPTGDSDYRPVDDADRDEYTSP